MLFAYCPSGHVKASARHWKTSQAYFILFRKERYFFLKFSGLAGTHLPLISVWGISGSCKLFNFHIGFLLVSLIYSANNKAFNPAALDGYAAG